MLSINTKNMAINLPLSNVFLECGSGKAFKASSLPK